MYLEYCTYNKYIADYDRELQNIFEAVEYGVQGLALPIQHVREIYDYLPHGLTISAPLDYPLGMSSTKARLQSLHNYVQCNINAVDYVVNNYLVQIKYQDFLTEIKAAVSICSDYGCTLRVFLQADRYPGEIQLVNLYHDLGIEFVFPTIGYHRRDMCDLLIYAKTIQDEMNMNVIFNEQLWLPHHKDMILKSSLFGVRIYNMNFWCNN